jgi:hypothetical protein
MRVWSILKNFMNKKRMLSEFQELVKEWHPNKNGELMPENVYSGTHEKAWWICQKGHEWESEVRWRVKGTKCLLCSYKNEGVINIGDRFGKLTVTEKCPNPRGRPRWKVKCDCGNEKTVARKGLLKKTGPTKSCGCARFSGLSLGAKESAKKARLKPIEDLSGKRFGKLLAIKVHSANLDSRRRTYWEAKCDCGKDIVIRQDALKYSARSCGCLALDKNKARTLPENLSAKNNYFNKVKRGAEKRNLSFTLSFDQVMAISLRNCEYCGSEPKILEKLNESSKFFRNGIDRKDNNIGYEDKNCVTCCFTCNRAKGSMPYVKWISYLDDLTRYRVTILESRT